MEIFAVEKSKRRLHFVSSLIQTLLTCVDSGLCSGTSRLPAPPRAPACMKDWTGSPESCPRINQPQRELWRETDQHRTEKKAPITNPRLAFTKRMRLMDSIINYDNLYYLFSFLCYCVMIDPWHALVFLIFVFMHLVKGCEDFFFAPLAVDLLNLVWLPHSPFKPWRPDESSEGQLV